MNKIIDLSRNENYFATCEPLHGFDYRLYPDGQKTCEALAKHIGVRPDQLLLTAGSIGGLSLLFSALDLQHVAIPLPNYNAYQVLADQFGIQVFRSQVYLDSDPIKKISSLLNDSQPEAIIVSNPNNPTGIFLDPPILLEFIKKFKATLFIVDEAYIDFAKKSIDLLSYIESQSNLAVVRSFSKSHGLAGLRVGYVASNSALIKKLKDKAIPYSVNTFALQAIDKIAEGKLLPYVNETIKMREFLRKKLEKIPSVKVHHSDANFILIEIKDNFTDLLKNLKEQNLKVRILPQLNNFVRITIGPMPFMQKVINAFNATYSIKSNELILKDYLAHIENPYLQNVLQLIKEKDRFSVEALYNNIASDYEMAFSDRKHASQSLRLLPKNAVFDVAIDLGCGTGISTKNLERFSNRVIGLDLSKEMLHLAKQRINKDKTSFLKADFTKKLPFEDEQIDLVFSVGATRHLPLGSEIPFLKEVQRILKKQGQSIITYIIPSQDLKVRRIDDMLSEWMCQKGITDRRFDLDELFKNYQSAGLKIIKYKILSTNKLYQKIFIRAEK